MLDKALGAPDLFGFCMALEDGQRYALLFMVREALEDPLLSSADIQPLRLPSHSVPPAVVSSSHLMPFTARAASRI